MAIIYGKNTAVDYASGNLASFGKSYSRMGAAPLDMTEVWYDKTALEQYAAYRGVEQADGTFDTSSVTSYVGQRVVYVDELKNKVYNYSIQLDGSLKEIGTSPIGDNKTIVIAENGTVSLQGVNGLVFERDILGEDDQPTGKKEIVQYQPLMTSAGLIWIEPSKTTVEGLATLIEGLTQKVTTLENKVGTAAHGETAASGLYAELDKKANQNTTYTKSEVDAAIDNAVKGILGEDISEAYDTLKEIQDILEGTDGEAIDGLLETVEANKQAIGVLNGDNTVANSVDSKIANAIGRPGTPASGEENDEGYIPPVAGTGIHANIYSKSETDAQIALAVKNATGGTNASSVAAELSAYKTSNNTRVGSIETKLNDIENNAQVNKIEAVEPAQNAKITTSLSGKTVLINDSALVALVETAQSAANQGITDAATAKSVADAAAANAGNNTTAITGLSTRLNTAESNINTNTQAIANHATEFSTLKGRVDGHDTAIAGKAAQADLVNLQEVVGGHTTEINTLKTTTIPALQADINSKATSTALTEEINRATAAEQANAAEIAKIPNAINVAKEEAIGEVTKLANGAVATNTAAIENITKAETGAIAVAKAEALQAVSDLANGQVKANAEAIAKLNGEAGDAGSVATIADARIAAALAGADADFDTLKEMSDWLSTHKGSAAEMNTAIIANTDAIKAINETTIPNAIAAANKHTDDAIAALNITTTYETKEDAGKKLQAAKDYTDAQIPAALAAYKVKNVDDVSLQLSEAGVASIKAVSTDLLVQGNFELILNGGKANV